MAKTDKLRKVLWIILATLSIISLVFGLMKKVGLCAGESQSVQTYTDYPLYFGYGQGHEPINFDDSVVNYIQSQLGASSSNGTMKVILLNEVTDSTHYKVVVINDTPSTHFGVSSSGSFPTGTVSIGGWCTYWTVNGSTISMTWYAATSFTCQLNQYLETAPTGNSYVLKSGNLHAYPLWSNGNMSISDGTTDFFVYGAGNSGGGFDAPGFSEGFQDWIDSNLNPVDNTPPSTDTTPNWLQKILNGLNTLNNTVGGGFTTVFGWFSDLKDNISDKFEEFQDFISDKIDSFKSSLSGIAGLGSSFYSLGVQEGSFSLGTFLHNLFFCDPETIEDIWDDSETGAAVNDLKSTMGNIIACYTATPSEHVYWNFDFSNTTLFSNVGVISINFDWYNAIRTPVITLFSVFFFLGFLFLLVRKIPGIISGLSSSSDDK